MKLIGIIKNEFYFMNENKIVILNHHFKELKTINLDEPLEFILC